MPPCTSSKQASFRQPGSFQGGADMSPYLSRGTSWGCSGASSGSGVFGQLESDSLLSTAVTLCTDDGSPAGVHRLVGGMSEEPTGAKQARRKGKKSIDIPEIEISL